MSDKATIQCKRCRREEAPLEKAPMPGALGTEILASICPGCWSEWQSAEVMVINELKLDFMDPRSLTVLERHLREFLMLEEAQGD